jgi:hypothetical protein
MMWLAAKTVKEVCGAPLQLAHNIMLSLNHRHSGALYDAIIVVATTWRLHGGLKITPLQLFTPLAAGHLQTLQLHYKSGISYSLYTVGFYTVTFYTATFYTITFYMVIFHMVHFLYGPLFTQFIFYTVHFLYGHFLYGRFLYCSIL